MAKAARNYSHMAGSAGRCCHFMAGQLRVLRDLRSKLPFDEQWNAWEHLKPRPDIYDASGCQCCGCTIIRYSQKSGLHPAIVIGLAEASSLSSEFQARMAEWQNRTPFPTSPTNPA